MGELHGWQHGAIVNDLERMKLELQCAIFMNHERDNLRAALLACLEILRKPENGALHCRWCNASGAGEHFVECWYVEHCRAIDRAREQARVALGEL